MMKYLEMNIKSNISSYAHASGAREIKEIKEKRFYTGG